MISFLKKLVFSTPIRGEPAHPKGIKTSVVPGDMTMKQWEEGGYHEYFWERVNRRVEEIIKT